MAHRWPKDGISNCLQNSFTNKNGNLDSVILKRNPYTACWECKGMVIAHVNITITRPLRQAFVTLLKTRKTPRKIYQSGSGDISYFVSQNTQTTLLEGGEFLYSRKILQCMKDSILHQIYLLPSNRESTRKYWLTEGELSQQNLDIISKHRTMYFTNKF